MKLSEVFSGLGQPSFEELVRGISIGKLKTFQVYDTFKTRAHLTKVNTENLRKAAPRFWSRISESDEDFAKDLAQAVLVSRIDMIVAVLDFLGIPNENGFFNKDLDSKPFLTEGWAARVFEKFRGAFPESALLFYINHLAWELTKEPELFVPAA